MTTSSVLSVRNMTVHYGGICALSDVSIEVERGKITSLIGANGAGKSSLLRAISGLVQPTSGQIVFEGKEITALQAHQRVALGLAQAPEGRGVFPNLTVRENLMLGAYARNQDAAQAQIDWAFRTFPILQKRYEQLAGTLSGGEQQMLAVARALMSKPSTLLLDEPSLGLAPQIVATIFAVLKEVNAQGTSVLLVDQNAKSALKIAHRAYVLETGNIVLSGTGQELLTSDAVRQAYLGG